MKTNFSTLSYRIDWYFHHYKLAIEIDENRHSNRNIDYEVKRQKSIKQKLASKFIRTDPDKEVIVLELSIKYLGISNSQLKNSSK